MNGGYGRRVYGFSSTDLTVATPSCRAAAMVRAPSSSSSRTSVVTALDFNRPVFSSKSRPAASRRPSMELSAAVNLVPTLGSSTASMPQ